MVKKLTIMSVRRVKIKFSQKIVRMADTQKQ
nr:MAG TPA: hypothetical protein [Bacteriophage sp.]